MPGIREILSALRGSRQSAKPGVTRRDVLKSAGEALPEMGSPADDTLMGAELASDFFKQNPDKWLPEWGPLEEADPDDLVDAFLNILQASRE